MDGTCKLGNPWIGPPLMLSASCRIPCRQQQKHQPTHSDAPRFPWLPPWSVHSKKKNKKQKTKNNNLSEIDADDASGKKEEENKQDERRKKLGDVRIHIEMHIISRWYSSSIHRGGFKQVERIYDSYIRRREEDFNKSDGNQVWNVQGEKRRWIRKEEICCFFLFEKSESGRGFFLPSTK